MHTLAWMLMRKRIRKWQPRRGALAVVCGLLLLLTHGGTRARIDVSGKRLNLGVAKDAQPPVCIFVQASRQALPQLPRLMRRLHDDKNVYVLHLDTDIDEMAMADASFSLTSLPTNVYILPAEPVNYRGVSMVLNTLSAMTLALDLYRKYPWRYFINLSASDYPLIEPWLLRELLAHPGPARPFLSRSDDAQRMLGWRLGYFAVDDALTFSDEKREVMVTDFRNPIASRFRLEFSFAEAWMILPRHLVSYILRDTRARRLLLAFAYSLSAPEHYFATLIANSHFNETVVPHSMRHVIWTYQNKSAGQHPLYLDHLYDVEIQRDERAAAKLASSRLLFARKFSRPHSALKDVLDARGTDTQHIAAVAKHFYEKLGLVPPQT